MAFFFFFLLWPSLHCPSGEVERVRGLKKALRVGMKQENKEMCVRELEAVEASFQTLGLTCQHYPFKTHRCRTIRTIHFAHKFSIIETEKPLVWVQFMLAPVNHPLMGSFFTLRCHYLSHPRAQGLEVLVAAPFMVGGDLGDWRRGHPGLHMTRL